MVQAPPNPNANAQGGDLIAALAQALQPHLGERTGYRHDPSGSPATTGYIHGPGGTLSYPGVDQDVFHTIVGARGIIGQLPVRASVDTNPLFSVITGIQADTGDEKTEVCGDAPVAGILKTCMLTSVFGRYERQTRQIELNRLGQRNDRADPMDLRMVGSPIANTGLFMTSGPADSTVPGDVLRNEISVVFWELSVSLHRLLSQQLWTGDPANNNGDAYREITAFPQLVNTGHVDALTQTSCPSVDSDVKDFNYGTVDANASSLVEALTYMFRFVRDLAVRTGVMPVRWVFVMRPELFYEVSAVWPCAYLTYRCQLSDNERLNVDGAEQTRMRDEMRAGSYLLIDGIRIEVVEDDGVPIDTSTTNANVPEAAFSSDIYLIPMSVVGGRAVTFLEHMNYSNQAIQDAIGMTSMAIVEGPWITVWKFRNWCLQFQTKIEPRLILRTPWLAGRLQHVVSSPLQMTRSPFPSDPYFVNGGVTSRPGPSYYSLWKD